MSFSEQDFFYMQRALSLAHVAAKYNEVPVGAIVVLQDEIIGEGYNQPIQYHDPSAHAEMIALRQAATKINNYRLLNTTLYVTLEPCFMCAGAMVHARIERLVFGAYDPRTGVIQSKLQLFDAAFLNHHPLYQGGLCQDECGKILSDFFRERR